MVPLYRNSGPGKKIYHFFKLILLCICTFVVIIFWKPTAIFCMFYQDFKYETAGIIQVKTGGYFYEEGNIQTFYLKCTVRSKMYA
jgi:hypothetical protein